MKTTALFVSLVCLALCAPAHAGFVSFGCEFPDDPTTTCHNWNFDLNTATLNLSEALEMGGPDQVLMSGVTDEDPTFTVNQTITNSTSYTWTSYTLSLFAPGGATFVGTATSDKFGSSVVTPNLITFNSPLTVAPGESVIMNYAINVPTTGNFNFTLSQEAVPEPSTIILLGLGLLGFCFFRKRK